MIKYIGSKRKLLPQVEAAIKHCASPGASVVDLFSGAGHVSKHLRGCGYIVTANDMNYYAYCIADAYLSFFPLEATKYMQATISRLNRIKPGYSGYFTRTFCEGAKFFQPKNGQKVDAIRDEIEKLRKYDLYYNAYLVSLMEAADRVDNTTGVQMAYLKHWCKRSHNDLKLRPLDFPTGHVGKAVCGRAEDFFINSHKAYDVVYMDPPYNQHNYRGNYHIWETLCRWDEPEPYGKAQKRVDIRDVAFKSKFNFKRKAHQAMAEVVASVRAKHIVVSFNNEGYISREDMINILKTRGNVEVSTHDYDRYVGAKIGIHDLKGNKVGSVSHTKNKEHIFICEVTR